MRTPTNVWLCWSSGKDSAWALHTLRQDPAVEVTGLLTVVTAPYDRVAMHGVRRELLEAQAAAAGLPLHVAEIPAPCTDEQYRAVMATAVEAALAQGVQEMAFGDLFLEDVRAYRETMLDGTGLAPRFPLWDADTAALSRTMVAGGIEAWITCCDPAKLPAEFAGRRYDGALLDALPAGVDPCAERGEFHTCVTAGPMFSAPIPVAPGEIVERDGFIFADLLPA
ncbi:MAG: Dph6-related ATP pyrophosphatase [Planctomycetota bacterium]|jgi:uncharacterized protein (TIGR00290 family)